MRSASAASAAAAAAAAAAGESGVCDVIRIGVRCNVIGLRVTAEWDTQRGNKYHHMSTARATHHFT